MRSDEFESGMEDVFDTISDAIQDACDLLKNLSSTPRACDAMAAITTINGGMLTLNARCVEIWRQMLKHEEKESNFGADDAACRIPPQSPDECYLEAYCDEVLRLESLEYDAKE